MSYQFAHAETYAVKAKKAKGTAAQFNSVDQVFGEAERHPHYSTHVLDPRLPEPIMAYGGVTLAELKRRHDELLAEVRVKRSRNGREYTCGLKSDVPTLYTEIHSHPMKSADYLSAMAKGEQTPVQHWMRLAITDFKERMPPKVAFTIVLHTDESHVHFHILAVNAGDPQLNANKLHIGKQAVSEWNATLGAGQKIEGLPRPAMEKPPPKPRKPRPARKQSTQDQRAKAYSQAISAWQARCSQIKSQHSNSLKQWQVDNKAHLHAERLKRKKDGTDSASASKIMRAAMKNWQDEYYEAVGRPSGLLRSGPRGQRLTTVQVKLRKQEAARIAQSYDNIEQMSKSAEARSQVIDHQSEALSVQAQRLSEREYALKAREADLKAQLLDKAALVQLKNEILALKADKRAAEVALGEGQRRLETASAHIATLTSDLTALEEQKQAAKAALDTVQIDLKSATDSLEATRSEAESLRQTQNKASARATSLTFGLQQLTDGVIAFAQPAQDEGPTLIWGLNAPAEAKARDLIISEIACARTDLKALGSVFQSAAAEVNKVALRDLDVAQNTLLENERLLKSRVKAFNTRKTALFAGLQFIVDGILTVEPAPDGGDSEARLKWGPSAPRGRSERETIKAAFQAATTDLKRIGAQIQYAAEATTGFEKAEIAAKSEKLAAQVDELLDLPWLHKDAKIEIRRILSDEAEDRYEM